MEGSLIHLIVQGGGNDKYKGVYYNSHTQASVCGCCNTYYIQTGRICLYSRSPVLKVSKPLATSKDTAEVPAPSFREMGQLMLYDVSGSKNELLRQKEITSFRIRANRTLLKFAKGIKQIFVSIGQAQHAILCRLQTEKSDSLFDTHGNTTKRDKQFLEKG